MMIDENRTSSNLTQVDDGNHALLRTLRSARGGSGPRRALVGATLPFRAVRLLAQNRKLVPMIVIPALINMLLFGLSAYFLLTHAGDWLDWLWQKPGGSGALEMLLVGLWYVVYAFALAASFVLAYVVVLFAGGVLASPFHDVLSEHTERILLGVEEIETQDVPFVRDMIRSFGSTLFIALLYAAIMGPILLLNLIPVAGSLVATALSAVVGAYFLGLEYTDPLLQRRGMPMKAKFRLIRDNFWLAGGFGLATSLCLWVPFLNFVCMPIAVIGGTALGVALKEEADAVEKSAK